MSQFLDNLKQFLDVPEDIWKHFFFFRDPHRDITPNENVLYAPADGTILYACTADANECFLEVKGIPNLSVSDILKKPIIGEVVIIGTFMSFFDPHVNRIPSSGILTYERIISDKLLSMLPVENALINETCPLQEDLEYILTNERMVNTVTSFVEKKPYTYYIVQIADADVDAIVPFRDQGYSYQQGDRFGAIRWGSQVDLIIPTNQNIDINILVETADHVKAGLSPLLFVK